MQDNYKDFLLDQHQPLNLAVTGKIFPYPNEVISVRIAIAKFYLSDNQDLNESGELSGVFEDSEEEVWI